MTNRSKIVLAGGLAFSAIAVAMLRPGPTPRLPLTALRDTGKPERYASDQMANGAGTTGWGLMAHYRLNADWAIEGPRLDQELKGLGFNRRFALRANGAEWDREDCVVRAQTHWTRATGNRLSDLQITRRARPGEIVGGWYASRFPRPPEIGSNR